MAATDQVASPGGKFVAHKWWRDRGTVLTGTALLAIAAAAWVGVVRQAMGMQALQPGRQMQAPMEMGGSTVSPVGAIAFLAAWGVMMAAMMLPSATPMIALYGTVSRSMSQSGKPVVPVTLFAATYLGVWLLFGLPVYLASVFIGAIADANPGVAGLLPYAVAAVLLAAGVYQFTALKRVCLRACQSPLSFLMSHWRGGYSGTLRIGLAHAVYCVGCCWGLMIILVAAGAMSLHWVLLIAAVVFAEKLLPRGEWTARAVGGALLLLGVLVAAQPGLVAVLRGQPM
jgi:predicted metal-binding membrane protein